MTVRPKRPVLAGNGLAGARVLGLLLDEWRPDEILVVAPAPTDRHDWQPALENEARRRGVEVIQPPKVNDPGVIDRLRAHKADVLLSAYYTQIFHPVLLDAIQGPSVNFHPSLLPLHRGTAPLIWAIAEGDTETGVSAHLLTAGVDTGPLLEQRRLAIHRDDTGHSLHLKASNLVAAIAARLLRGLLHGTGLPEPIEQSGPSSYHSLRDPRINHIQWDEPAERIRNVIRALAPPLPGAYTDINGIRVVLERVEIVQREHTHPAAMVEVDRASGLPFLWARDGQALEIVAAQVDDNRCSGLDLVERLGIRGGEQCR